MRISKKIFAIALSILMAVSMMPLTVFADALPTATVTEIAAPEGLDVAYKYVANDDGSAKYDSYLADFVISFDKDIESGDVKLGGAYDAYENGEWQIFDCPALAAGQEYKLLAEGVSALLGRDVSMTYEEIRTIVQEFRCGVAGVDAAGATMTVKLNLYDPATGEATEIVSGTKEYTFEDDTLPTINVEQIAPPEDLDLAFEYTVDEDGSPKYDDYLADFVISFDQDIAEGQVQLGGAYDAYDDGNWQIFDCPALAAGQEYRLLKDGVSALLGRDVSMTYAEIRDYVQSFRCGIAGLEESGVTVTVKLNLYEAVDSDAIELESATQEYTFEEEVAIDDYFNISIEDTLVFELAVYDSRAERVEFTFNGTPQTETYVPATAEGTYIGDGYYMCDVVLAPAQLFDEVTYKVFNADGEVVRENTTTAYEYLTLLLEDGDYDDYDELCMAIYDYAKAAAEYFNYNADAYVLPYYYNAPEWKTAFWSASDASGKVTEVSYVATTTPALRFTMNLTEEEAAALSVTSNIGTAGFYKRGNDVVLEVKGIPISQLHTTLVVNIEGLGEIVYTPLLYANKVSELNNSLARLGISIANVNAAAASYY